MHLAYWLGFMFAVSEVVLGMVKRARSEGGGQLADRGTLRILWVVIGVSNVFAYRAAHSFPRTDLGTDFATIGQPLGVMLFVAGLVLRWYSIFYLGRFFTVNVAIAADHQLIDTGPYHHVRHPSYSGALLAFSGLALVINNWLSSLIMLIPIFGVFTWRMHIEEAALSHGLGDRYRDYMRRTKRLIPAVY